MLLQIYTNKKFNISLFLFETSTFQVFLKPTSKCAFPRPSALFLNMVLEVNIASSRKKHIGMLEGTFGIGFRPNCAINDQILSL